VKEIIKLAQLIQHIVSIILYFVIFFGLAFILNMLLRRTWLMAFLYPFIVIIIIDGIPVSKYFTAPSEAFSTVFNVLVGITVVDWIILISGFVGAIVSGMVIKYLRKSGYQMF